jgi:cytochrome c5
MLILFSICGAAGSDTGSAGAKPGQQDAASPPATAPKISKQLTGAELYAINCNRCHAERSPTERTAAEWQTILMHMRVRANLPAAQARMILKYLQENSGS